MPTVGIWNTVPNVSISVKGQRAASNIWTYDQSGITYDEINLYYDGIPPAQEIFGSHVFIRNAIPNVKILNI